MEFLRRSFTALKKDSGAANSSSTGPNSNSSTSSKAPASAAAASASTTGASAASKPKLPPVSSASAKAPAASASASSAGKELNDIPIKQRSKSVVYKEPVGKDVALDERLKVRAKSVRRRSVNTPGELPAKERVNVSWGT